MPSPPEVYVIQLENPRARLIIRRRDDGALDVRVARCSYLSDPREPGNFRPTQGGFRLTRVESIELRAALRAMAGV